MRDGHEFIDEPGASRHLSVAELEGAGEAVPKLARLREMGSSSFPVESGEGLTATG